ncbi:putative serine/threonine-protein kinase-like protein CCR3 [Carex littledalei]|uniref:Putative serine/threonine-protein kinase-like protein CCR3 n=1 Tax=Carex littledalei TaxID=544730 RepID=A0A833R8H3_9POAL|nr:putative serine/threonine-protein kinase-like protein CCR3 [Carex littledalei]
MRFELEFFTVLTVVALLFFSSDAVGSTGTLAISFGTGTVCGISASSLPRAVYCTNISGSVSTSPYQVLSTVSFDSVSAGDAYLCGLKTGGEAFFCWNGDSSSIKRVYNGSPAVADLTVGETQVSAVDLSGNGIRWWRTANLFPPSVLGNYSSLTSGNNFTCAINTNGTVSCWGPLNNTMQSRFSNYSMTTIVAGDSHICGLNKSGFVICGGSNSSGESYAPAGSPYEYTRFALGSRHTCAIKRPNGIAVCWGGPGGAQLYMPLNGTSFEFLVAGGNLTCGLTTNNYTVLCWDSHFRNVSVRTLPLPKILPGICVAGGDDICSCGTYPDSGSLCAGTGVICQRCDYQNPVIASPPPALAPAPSGSSVHIGWRVYAIIGTVGTFLGLCAVAYFVWLICRRKKVHNSVMPTIAPPSASNNTGVATAITHSSSGGNGGRIRFYSRSSSAPRSRIFSRQWSRALQRQGSGPSSFKDHADEFSFQELEKATKFFSLELKIGAGSFGIVYRGLLPDGREVAIKRGEANSRNKRFQEKEDAFQSELAFLSRLNHKHLVSLTGFCVENDERLLVYEYMKNGALHDHLHPKNNDFESPVISSWKMRIKILLDASRGIEYLHNYAVPPIIHRDIKSSNILLDANWVARVSDFGLSLTGPNTEEGHLETKAAGTVGYMDPEYYGTNQVTVRSDVYGFGVVMLEVLTGKRAIFKYEGGDGEPVSVVDYAVPRIDAGEVGSIVDSRVAPAASQEVEALELIAYMAKHCVRLEGRERPSIADVVVHLETALALIEDGLRSGSSTSASIHSLETRD